MESHAFPTINASRIRLRPIASTDVDAMYMVFSNPEVMRYWSTPPLPNKVAAEELVSEILNDIARGKMMKWGIARRADDFVIGTTTLFNLDRDNGRAELGYALGREHWGNGFMTEALQALLEYAFEELKLRRLEADVDPRNAASIRTLERLGFKREGFLRERWHVADEIQDALFYGLLKREWNRRFMAQTPQIDS
jgi:RimJ/RimL family protein N-acetyltransferase